MLDDATTAAYDAARNISSQPFRAACYSPFVSMFFHPTGDVRACCMNRRHQLGNIAQQTIDEIWNGPAVQEMRQAMLDYQFVKGCDACVWQIRDGNFSLKDINYQPVHALKYDDLIAKADGKFWPVNMEFNLSNLCNLECIMCYGEVSSLIRANREKLPPLPQLYDDTFLADLRKYLPHLELASFLGGEPFLIQQNFRIWEMIIEDRLKPNLKITTNGTQFNTKVQQILDRLRISINLSMDGVRPETLESIRLNVKYDKFMANFRRFHEYCRGVESAFGLNFALMRPNWREFREFLQFADEWGAYVSVCTASEPPHLSLYTLSREEMQEIVEHWRRQESSASGRLGLNQPVWEATLSSLAHRVEHFDDDSLQFVYVNQAEVEAAQTRHAAWLAAHGTDVFGRVNFLQPTPTMTTYFAPVCRDGRAADLASLSANASAALNAWSPGAVVDTLVCDLEDRVIDASARAGGLLESLGTDLIGLPDKEVFARLCARWGEGVVPVEEQVSLERTDRVIRFTNADGVITDIRVITVPRYDAAAALIGSRTFVAVGGVRLTDPASNLERSYPLAPGQ